MEIKIQIKNQYGQERVYPLCPAAKTFARIAGTATLTPDVIEQIKKLGYRVAVCSPAYL